MKVEKAAAAIVKAVRANPNISGADLNNDIERGAIDGWLELPEVKACNISEWTMAMVAARNYLFPGA